MAVCSWLHNTISPLRAGAGVQVNTECTEIYHQPRSATSCKLLSTLTLLQKSWPVCSWKAFCSDSTIWFELCAVAHVCACDDDLCKGKQYADLVKVCVTAGACMRVCAGVRKPVCARMFVCLEGVLQSQRYNGLTPSFCEVLQRNLKQGTAAGREPGLACSWITSLGNSRYAISAA